MMQPFSAENLHPLQSKEPAVFSDVRMKNLCERYHFDSEKTVRLIIQTSFPKKKRWKKEKPEKPQAFQLSRALNLLQTYLGTQDINEMINWAFGADPK